MSDYLDDISIKKHKLDWEWERQPDLFLKYSQEFQHNLILCDRVKEKLDVIKANLNLEIRKDPEGYLGNVKMTEGAIAAVIELDEEYRDARDEFLTAQKNVQILKSVVEALHHKKSALENMVKLWLGGYYASPNVPNEAKERSSSDTRDKQNAGLKRRQRLKTGDK